MRSQVSASESCPSGCNKHKGFRDSTGKITDEETTPEPRPGRVGSLPVQPSPGLPAFAPDLRMAVAGICHPDDISISAGEWDHTGGRYALTHHCQLVSGLTGCGKIWRLAGNDWEKTRLTVICSDCILRHLRFLEIRREDPRAVVEIEKIKQRILAPGTISYDPNKENIGLFGVPAPLNYAPNPDSLLRTVFTNEQIERDLDRLVAQQQDDGRWDTWYGISPGTRLEWAGIQTLKSLKILKAYNRIEGMDS